MFGREGGVTFLSPNNSEILAHSGSTVTFSCRLTRSPSFGMVTWSRQLASEKTIQVLSIGDSIHISDQRFLIAKTQQDNDWELRLQGVAQYDSGEYRCQATTHPPTFIATQLIVVDAYAEIQVEDRDTSEKRRDEAAGQAESGTAEQNEKFIKRGSELKLRCYLRKATEAPAYIFWFHNQTMVNYSPGLGREVVEHQDGRGSTLTIEEAGPRDGGNYTCAPHNIHPHSVIVNIMDTEGKYAAVHRDGNSGSPACTALVNVQLLTIVLAVF